MITSESKINMQAFIKTPNPLLFLYPFHPDFKAEMATLYALITHYYNEDIGYAWPNIDTLAFYYGKSAKTTSAHLDALKSVGLIEIIERGQKKQFIPLKPIDNEAEFFAKFPEALAEYNKRNQAREEERKRSAEHMAKLRARQRGEIEQKAPDDDWLKWL